MLTQHLTMSDAACRARARGTSCGSLSNRLGSSGRDAAGGRTCTGATAHPVGLQPEVTLPADSARRPGSRLPNPQNPGCRGGTRALCFHRVRVWVPRRFESGPEEKMSTLTCTGADGTKWQIWKDGNGRWHWRTTKSGSQGATKASAAGFSTQAMCIADAVANGMDCTPTAEIDPEIESEPAADTDTDPGPPSP